MLFVSLSIVKVFIFNLLTRPSAAIRTFITQLGNTIKAIIEESSDAECLPILRVELSRERHFERLSSSDRLFVLGQRRAASDAQPCCISRFFGCFIGRGGFTDDFTQTANAGRSPHSQLCADDGGLLHPLSGRFRQTLQQTARPAGARRGPLVATAPAQREARKAVQLYSGRLRAPLLLQPYSEPQG